MTQLEIVFEKNIFRDKEKRKQQQPFTPMKVTGSEWGNVSIRQCAQNRSPYDRHLPSIETPRKTCHSSVKWMSHKNIRENPFIIFSQIERIPSTKTLTKMKNSICLPFYGNRCCFQSFQILNHIWNTTHVSQNSIQTKMNNEKTIWIGYWGLIWSNLNAKL